MNTKIVYVLVSNGHDFYTEQLYLSLVSLKMHSPESEAYVVVDKGTEKVLRSLRLDILSYIKEIIVVDVPEKYKGTACSRFLKTSLRKYCSGPYLFVDTDTIIAEELYAIDELIDKGIHIAAVKDAHCTFREMPTYQQVVKRFNKVGWSDNVDDEIHFNSGVMFVADTEESHAFYNRWHQNWLYEQTKGFYFDQLAMARTNRECGCLIKEIDGVWNFQIWWGVIKYLHNSKIIHYGGYVRQDMEAYYFRKESVLVAIRNSNGLSEETLEHLRNPKAAYVGKVIVLGEDYLMYTRSRLRDEYMFHPIRFRMYEITAAIIQSLSGKIKRLIMV